MLNNSTKVYQDKFGGSSSPINEQGNCFQACVATLFQLPLEEAFNPNIYPTENPHWWDQFIKWLKPFGLSCVRIEGDGGGDLGLFIQERKSTTLSDPDDTHVVVAYMEDGYISILHDPNPEATHFGDVISNFVFTPLHIKKFSP